MRDSDDDDGDGDGDGAHTTTPLSVQHFGHLQSIILSPLMDSNFPECSRPFRNFLCQFGVLSDNPRSVS